MSQAPTSIVNSAELPYFVPIFLLLVPGAVGGTMLLATVPGSLLVLLLGCMVTAYAVMSLWRLRLVISPRMNGGSVPWLAWALASSVVPRVCSRHRW